MSLQRDARDREWRILCIDDVRCKKDLISQQVHRVIERLVRVQTLVCI